MKNIVFLIVLCSFAISCSKSDDNDERPEEINLKMIVGTWNISSQKIFSSADGSEIKMIPVAKCWAMREYIFGLVETFTIGYYAEKEGGECVRNVEYDTNGTYHFDGETKVLTLSDEEGVVAEGVLETLTETEMQLRLDVVDSDDDGIADYEIMIFKKQ